MKMTKKKVFFISLLVVILSILLSPEYIYEYCFSKGHCWRFWEIVNSAMPFFFIFLPILSFSVITYFLKEEIFKAWLKFTYWYLPIYILVILLLSGMGGGGGYIVGDIFNSEFFALNLSGLYIIISLIFVIYKAVSLKGAKK